MLSFKFYRLQLIEYFLKLRYNNAILNNSIKFFFKNFYNTKYLFVLKSKNKTLNFKKIIFFFSQLYLFKFIININFLNELKLILKTRYRLMNYKIFIQKNHVLIGTQNFELFQQFISDFNLFIETLQTKDTILVENIKFLSKIKSKTHLISSNSFWMIPFMNFNNISKNFFFRFNLILYKYVFLSHLFLIINILLWILYYFYYGYIKAIDKRMS